MIGVPDTDLAREGETEIFVGMFEGGGRGVLVLVLFLVVELRGGGGDCFVGETPESRIGCWGCRLGCGVEEAEAEAEDEDVGRCA